MEARSALNLDCVLCRNGGVWIRIEDSAGCRIEPERAVILEGSKAASDDVGNNL
jgi:hypothetical protein